MPIKPQAPPFDGFSEINRFVPKLLGDSAVHLLAAGAPPVKASQPLQLFIVGLDRITDTDFIRYAKPVSWRYLIVSDRPVAVAELKSRGSEDAAAFSTLIHGAMAAKLAAASEKAEATYAGSAETYEPRILEIPALYVTALWLHGERDVFFPFDVSAPPTERIEEDPQFLDHVVQLANRKKPSGPPVLSR